MKRNILIPLFKIIDITLIVGRGSKAMASRRELELGTLRSFVTIAEAGSMTRAANRLRMTQSAVSMQIKRLEDSLDMALFERTSRGMAPTASGDQLLTYASQMLSLNDEALENLIAHFPVLK